MPARTPRDFVPRLDALAAIAGLCFLSTVYGGISMLYSLPPSRLLRRTHQVARDLVKSGGQPRDALAESPWQPATHRGTGVTRCDSARAFHGYTLYTSGHAQNACLVGLDGRTVHEWSLPDDSEPGAVAGPSGTDPRAAWYDAHLFPNGDLLAVVEREGALPRGRGIVKLDRGSRLLWRYGDGAHHSVSVGDDGRVYGLAHEVCTKPKEGFGLTYPCVEDFVVVLTAGGERKKRVSLLDAFAKSRLKPLVEQAPRGDGGEYLRCNGVQVVTGRIARLAPFAREGQVFVSMGLFSAVVLLDLETDSIVRVLVGPWSEQRDPEFVENGNLLMIDGRGDLESGGGSRVLELDLVNLGVLWSYRGQPGDLLRGIGRSAQQRLPNGNTLISESDAGRLIEVTAEGEVVWEYVNPVRGGRDEKLIAVVCAGSRISADSLDADFRAHLSSVNPG